jgi:superfamily II DNA or RNA helicase
MSKPGLKKQQKQKARQERLRKAKAGHEAGQNLAWYADDAYIYFTNGEWQACIEMCRKALRVNPDHVPTLNRYAYALGKVNDLAGRLAVERKLAVLLPEKLPALYNCAILEYQTGEYASALKTSEKLQGLKGLQPGLKKAIAQLQQDCRLRMERGQLIRSQAAPEPASRQARQSTEASNPAKAESPAAAPPSLLPAETRLDYVEPVIRFTFPLAAVQLLSPDGAMQPVDTLFWLRQRIGYEHLRMRQEFEELLCLHELSNIQHFGYQQETVRKALKLFHGRVLLADEVGLGKTIEACMIVKEYLLRGMIKSVLVLCPPALVVQWSQEFSSKFGIKAVHLPDAALMRRNKEWFWSQNIVIVSLHTAKGKTHAASVVERDWDMVVVDEAHHLKNRRTQSWKFINEIKKKFILLLSATPVQNDLSELYNLITLLKPGLFPLEREFKRQYVNPKDPRQPLNTDALRLLMRDVMIRNTRAGCGVTFTKRFAQTMVIPPSPPEREIYREICDIVRELHEEADFRLGTNLRLLMERAGAHLPGTVPLLRALRKSLDRKDTGGAKADPRIIERINSLSQAVTTTQAGNSKAARLTELLSMSQERTIVFCRHKSTLDHLGESLCRISRPLCTFHGGLPAEVKSRNLELFKEQEGAVLLSSESGGEGHNLQFCNTIVNFDLPWNPMSLEQRIGRIHRIGQRRDVFVFNLCYADTLEEKILHLLEKKVRMFELVVGEVDSILGNLEEQGGFEAVVLDLWIKNQEAGERDRSFDRLGRELESYREQYGSTKQLDHDLFGEDLET